MAHVFNDLFQNRARSVRFLEARRDINLTKVLHQV